MPLRKRKGINISSTYEMTNEDLERFHTKYYKDEKTGCWLLFKGRSFNLGRKTESLTRVSYFIAKGPVDSGRKIFHNCGNLNCINPGHMEYARDVIKHNGEVLEKNQYLHTNNTVWTLSEKDVERFHSKYEKKNDNDCWNWTGTFSHGYGDFCLGIIFKAHRISYFLKHGNIEKGKIIRHKCDNRCCVNPSHLEPGNTQDNMDDMVRRGRSIHRYGEENPKVSLTWEKVDKIRELRKSGLTLQAIGDMFGVTATNISCICKNKNWKEEHKPKVITS